MVSCLNKTVSKDNSVLEQCLKTLTEISKDHEKRLRVLERYMFMVAGAVFVLKLLIK